MEDEESNGEAEAQLSPWPARISRLTAAGHLFGHHLCPSRWVSVSNQIWSRKSALSRDCDVVLTFPRRTSEGVIYWLRAQLELQAPQLTINVKFHKCSKNWCFYFTANWDNFLLGAEQLRLKKSLRPEFGGGLKEFVREQVDLYEGSSDQGTFMTSMEKQSVIWHFLERVTANRNNQHADVKIQNGQSIVAKCLASNKVKCVFPLHDVEALQSLRQNWVQAFLQTQPLDAISDYFGVKIAIYFAWLGHYTKALALPSALGLCIWLLGYGGPHHHGNEDNEPDESSDCWFVGFALFNVIWATLYLECWKRRCAELSHRWGTLDVENELLAQPRPLFSAPLRSSPITGQLEPHFPAWKRNCIRYGVSLPVIGTCLAIVVYSMLSLLQLQDWWDDVVDRRSYPDWLKMFPKILMALVIALLDALYSKIAYLLNDAENYRLEEEYENHLITKIAIFQFVNSFLSLFYIAFYLRDMNMLKEQLAALLITRQIFGNIKESILPFLFETLKLSRLSSTSGPFSLKSFLKTTTATTTTAPGKQRDELVQAEVEGALFAYEGMFEDYLEMFIQFGYVVLFSPAFPLAALFALLNNLIEIRSDAFKLCVIFQRPFGHKAKNIGAWQTAMECMGVMAVVVNCALIGTSGFLERKFPSLGPVQITILIVVLEHVILLVKVCLSRAIPDVPQWVATEIAKVEFRRREAIQVVQRTELAQRKSTIVSNNRSKID